MGTHTIVVPIDGSAQALRALDAAIGRAKLIKDTHIHAINVQPPIPSSVGEFVGSSAVREFQAEEAEKALPAAREKLATAKVASTVLFRSGQAADVITRYAREVGAQEIIMGTRGLSALSGLMLGSVATRVTQQADIPVTLVK